jgi:predicted tellurium resistance membrane protein TerC
MEWIELISTLLMLVALEAVLGIDNLLYIAIESGRVEDRDRKRVQRIGIGGAVAMRLVLFVVLVQLIALFQSSMFSIQWSPFVTGEFNGHSLIAMFGGAFIVYTAIKEVWHMLAGDLHSEDSGGSKKSAKSAIAAIILMNVVFSFDSVLTAIALTDSMPVMLALANRVAAFLRKNRAYEVLGLFILLLVGVMLLSEGGHLAHLTLFGGEVHALNKTTFYFSVTVLILVDLVQSRYQKRLANRS